MEVSIITRIEKIVYSNHAGYELDACDDHVKVYEVSIVGSITAEEI